MSSGKNPRLVLIGVVILIIAVFAGVVSVYEKRLSVLERSTSRFEGKNKKTKILAGNEIASLEKIVTALNKASKNLEYGQPALRSDLLAVRRLALNLDPRLTGVTDSFKLAVLLRDHVYKSVPQKDTGNEYLRGSIFDYYQRAVRDPEVGLICQGLSMTYRIVLEAFGIPSRGVSMFSSKNGLDNSHTSVEVYIDGRWVISDPTFNLMFESDGKYLGWEVLRARILKGAPYKSTSNGMKVRPNDSLENYFAPLSELVKYLAIQPAMVRTLMKEKHFKIRLMPDGWDGFVIMEGGKRLNIIPNKNEIESKIAEGILR